MSAFPQKSAAEIHFGLVTLCHNEPWRMRPLNEEEEEKRFQIKNAKQDYTSVSFEPYTMVSAEMYVRWKYNLFLIMNLRGGG